MGDILKRGQKWAIRYFDSDGKRRVRTTAARSHASTTTRGESSLCSRTGAGCFVRAHDGRSSHVLVSSGG